jgi:hypothetical protein
VRSRSLAVSSERKLDGWKPWTATDNRSPILARHGYANLFLFFTASKPDPAFVQQALNFGSRSLGFQLKNRSEIAHFQP